MLLASARGERAPAIAKYLGCDDQTVRNAIKGFNTAGLAVLNEGSSRPHRLRTTFTIEAAQQLKALLHRSPHDFGLDRGLWTLELAAKISFEQGIIPHTTSVASVRRALQSIGTNWKRANHWITSPDPLDQQKKRTRSADRLGEHPAWLGYRVCRRGVVEQVRSSSAVCPGREKDHPVRLVEQTGAKRGS